MEDIFSLENTDSLPEEVKSQIYVNSLKKGSKMLLELFSIKSELSIDEIIVGYYRKFDLIKSRTWVSSNLYNLSKKGMIYKVKGKKGVYKKSEI